MPHPLFVVGKRFIHRIERTDLKLRSKLKRLCPQND
ncbi:hypothetical protein DMC15_12140 [Vibrio sp. 11986-1-5]|nr:hypothetical protein [Vibrio metschnikovii]EKO3792386.1 hypothetical protein [Vibrio metschnikovii]PXA70967.1 hypothetical protein DMC15_12140 [Vibrio sp. 11986-1-5]